MNNFFIQSFSKKENESPLSTVIRKKHKNILIDCFNIKSIALAMIAINILSSTNLKNTFNEEKKIVHNQIAKYEPTSEEIEFAKKEYAQWVKKSRNTSYSLSIDEKNKTIKEEYNVSKNPQFNYSLDDLKTNNPLNDRYFSNNYIGTPSDEELKMIAEPYGIDYKILKFVMLKESNGDCFKISNKGAQGCFQFMDNTAQEFGVNIPENGYQSADGAARYMLWLNKLINGKDKDINDLNNLQYVLAAYNAGLSNVIKNDGVKIPNFPETTSYVEDIIGALNGTKHYVKKGELIHDIANKYEISFNTLQRANLFKINKNDDLKWGHFIDIEDKDNVEIKIKITKGLNLYRTSLRTGVSLDEIMRYNNIDNPNKIKLGAYLIIPPKELLAKKINNELSLKID